jgi:hypothetical protein
MPDRQDVDDPIDINHFKINADRLDDERSHGVEVRRPLLFRIDGKKLVDGCRG